MQSPAPMGMHRRTPEGILHEPWRAIAHRAVALWNSNSGKRPFHRVHWSTAAECAIADRFGILHRRWADERMDRPDCGERGLDRRRCDGLHNRAMARPCRAAASGSKAPPEDG